ncbi:MAG TPA: hypothetical protein VHY91_16550 [Pirellulales bacterium]|nr:hypothetical protein [Pirellulales bacterium]
MAFRFNFHGGFLDGQSMVSGWDRDGQTLPGERYVFLSDGGRLGARFRETPPERTAEIRRMLAAGPPDREHAQEFHERRKQLGSQVYEVTRRDERPSETVVRVDFVGEESEGTTVGGATDEPYVDLFVDIHLPDGRPDADDLATRDAMLAELMQHCQSMRGILEDPGTLYFITRWSDEATGRQRIADVLDRLLPGIEFTITAIHGPTASP